MTQHAQKFIQESGDTNVIPFLQLAEQLEGGGVRGTGPHRVKMLNDEAGTKPDYQTKVPIQGLWFYFLEGGQKVKYFVPFKDKTGRVHYLMERFARVKEGDEVILEYIRKPGSKTGYIDVKAAQIAQPRQSYGYGPQISEEEIPVVEREVPEDDFDKVPDEAYM